MKKLIIAILCLLLVGLFAVPAFAADTVQFTITPSKTTAGRGDTITFTVAASGSEACTQYGLKLDYDSTVYEMVGGECTASGALLANFSPDKGFAVLYSSATTPSGTVGTFTLKVKDTARLGVAAVSGAASAKNGSATVASVGDSVNVTIACNHSYSTWTKADSTNHTRTCSVCGDVQTVAHTWKSGAVTKQPSCKETGVKTYTCTGCNATKTEDIGKLTTHTYGDWTKVNDITHKHVCSVCQKEETANHSWNNGAVTKQPTCKEEGVKTYTCTVCGGTKTKSIAKLTTHTYDNACDSDCNICSETRSITHSYKSGWSQSKTEHWHECTICGEKKDNASHTPGAAATETTAQTCTDCGYVIQAALGHTHSYSNTLTYDSTNHWYACSGCSEKKNAEKHSFDNACDTKCNTCGYTRTITHNYGQNWLSDDSNHWHVCTSCGDKKDEAAHVPGTAATETTAQTCTVCNYAIKEALGHTHAFGDIWLNDGIKHWHVCVCGEKADEAAHSWDKNLCTICGAQNSNVVEPTVPDETEPSAAPTAPTTIPDPNPSTPSTPTDDEIPLWIPVVLLIMVAGALVAYFLIKRRS